MSDYIPIDCETYANYELVIMHHQRLRLVWRDSDGTTHLETLLPVDLETRNHAEYLHVEGPGGERRQIRLDRILRADPQ